MERKELEKVSDFTLGEENTAFAHLSLSPEFMKELVDYVKGTIVECNTAYPGRRMES